MGLPVLVIETSCNPLLTAVPARIDGLLAAARKPLEAGETQDFCMAERWATNTAVWSRSMFHRVFRDTEVEPLSGQGFLFRASG